MTIECKVSGKYLNVWKLKEIIEKNDSSVDTIKFIIDDYVEGYPFENWSWWLRFKTSLSKGTLIRLDDEYDSENKKVILTWNPDFETFTDFAGSIEFQICGSLGTEQGLLKWNSNTATLKINDSIELEVDEKVTPDLFEQYLNEFEKIYSGVVNDFKEQLEDFIQTKQDLQNQITDEVNRATAKETELEERINNIPDLSEHLTDYDNPHKVTKSQIGLDKVDNTPDRLKPVSELQEARIQEFVGSINAETQRATNAENEIKGYLNSLYNKNPASGVKSGEIHEDIEDEKSRAVAKETELENLINEKTADVSQVREDLDNHIADKNNPHNVTLEQLNGISQNEKSNTIPTLDANKKLDSRFVPFGLDNFEQGYFYNDKFYKEVAHTTEIEKNVKKIYVDLSSVNKQLYAYNGNEYFKLSLADFTNYYTISQTDNLLSGKVDKETGKGLSSNDFSSSEKAKLSGIEPQSQVNKLESISVDGIPVLIDENKNAEIHIPDAPVQSVSVNHNPIEPDEDGNINIDISEEVGAKGVSVDGVDQPFDSRNYAQINLQERFNGKVDKEEGKGLTSNDFTDAHKNKLVSLNPDAEPNILDGVKVSGIELEIVNKKVNITYDGELNSTSANAVQNRVLNAKFNLVKIESEQYTDGAVEDYKRVVDAQLEEKMNVADIGEIPNSIIDNMFEV